jgi:hypothetical protein
MRRNFAAKVKQYINGKWLESAAKKHYELLNPAT